MNMNQQSELIDLTRFDVREIPCRVKHAQIFQRWTELPVGRFFVLVNDHDPIPLYHQFAAQFPGAFKWEYLLRGPDEFQVKITRLSLTSPVESSTRTCTSGVDPNPVFDVRSIPARVKHVQIFQRWFDLPVGGHFVLLNDHDPVPLRYQFEAEFPGAFLWDYLATGPDEFRVKITKLRALTPRASGSLAEATPRAAAVSLAASDGVLEIDARGLEPPEPLIRILNALESLPSGGCLRAITDREPCHLFGEAEQRGFRHDTAEQSDGSWVTLLERA
jgi:uncharacterized protein (DUF2249 family)